MRIAGILTILAAVAAASIAPPAGAQHATASDIADGERAFADSCANCHGPDGNLIAGIDFSRGLYRREYTDAELIDLIINGIPETPMPPTPGMSEPQAERIVSYLRALADEARGPAVEGSPERGSELFFGKGECTDCHAVDGVGARHGPDLSSIGRERRAAEIEQALVDPQAVIAPTNRTYQVVTASGAVISGRLLNHDTFTVQLIDTDDRLRSFDKADLREHGFVESPMPAYRETLSAGEIADLVSFLVAQQGPE